MVVKHTPSTDALETLGNIIHPSEKRDAIHLAVDPAFSREYLNPGDHVRIIAKGQVSRCAIGQGHGIVDPFLRHPVQPGEYFWLVVYPREITSLRHVWSHPAFEDEPQRVPQVAHPMPNFASDTTPKPFSAVTSREPETFAELQHAAMLTSMVAVPRPEKTRSLDDEATKAAREWIYNFAKECGLDYDELVEAAGDYLDHGDYLVKGGDLEGYSVPDEFWDHYQVVKKEKVEESDRGSFFSCSC